MKTEAKKQVKKMNKLDKAELKRWKECSKNRAEFGSVHNWSCSLCENYNEYEIFDIIKGLEEKIFFPVRL